MADLRLSLLQIRIPLFSDPNIQHVFTRSCSAGDANCAGARVCRQWVGRAVMGGVGGWDGWDGWVGWWCGCNSIQRDHDIRQAHLDLCQDQPTTGRAVRMFRRGEGSSGPPFWVTNVSTLWMYPLGPYGYAHQARNVGIRTHHDSSVSCGWNVWNVGQSQSPVWAHRNTLSTRQRRGEVNSNSGLKSPSNNTQRDSCAKGDFQAAATHGVTLCRYTCTHTHTHAHTHTHTHIHTHTRTNVHTLTRTHTQRHTDSHTLTHTHTHTQRHTHSHTQKHTHTHTHACTHTHAHTHVHTYTCTHTHSHTLTHTHTHCPNTTHTHTLTQTHTLTHTHCPNTTHTHTHSHTHTLTHTHTHTPAKPATPEAQQPTPVGTSPRQKIHNEFQFWMSGAPDP